MYILKSLSLILIFFTSMLIGRYIAMQYLYRLRELEDIKNALNIFKSKIKFTYEPIPIIFEEIAKSTSSNISKLFFNAKEKMKDKNASIAWDEVTDEYKGNINKEDKQALKYLSKSLGNSDVEGQINQIELTETFIDKQILDAEKEKNKNFKLFKKLGATIGIAIVIILL